jgi:nucleotide-binding universal stress UspA family protein
MVKRILVALDNSAVADKAMHQALDLAKLYQAQLFAVSVINYSVIGEIDESSPSPMVTETIYYWTNSFQKVLDKCKQLAGEIGIEHYHQAMLSGYPAEEIVKYAEKKNIDLIVMGHIGKSAAAGFLIGSVSQKVSTHSKCSVLIVK